MVQLKQLTILALAAAAYADPNANEAPNGGLVARGAKPQSTIVLFDGGSSKTTAETAATATTNVVNVVINVDDDCCPQEEGR
ncbi:hypothetical protein BDD12DRAFT_876107 [Trichophaea hybrida]|nr:hypothetical protein BDD12DRAFT_876107 [Trichophaea hybrida]